MKRYAGHRVCVDAFKRGGYYVLRIRNYKTFLVATKGSKKSHWESGWMPAYEMKFETKERANKYFAGIKRNNFDLVLTEDLPNKYISHDGSIKSF